LGISIGDPAGIGPEICLKALSKIDIFKKAIPIVYADRIVLEGAIKIIGKNFILRQIKEPSEVLGNPGTIEFIESGIIKEPKDYSLGETSAKAGDAAFNYVLKALNDAMAKNIQAVVTCPISKEAINLAGYQFAGHTEIFAHYTNTKDYGMLLSANLGGHSLNVIHATTHVPLRKACELITKERILKTISLADNSLNLMGSDQRRIAVAGLNPHSSENGLFGNEEAESIIPAIEEAKAKGLNVTGPVPPDTVFVKALGGQFDIVVAMYHDQGHIPLKLCGFSLDASGGSTRMRGINTTIGLPVIRTSVDHGTAFDIAGKNLANEESLLDALDMAVRFSRNISNPS
jgi:4-hydroxythreonine-4-phosphate dehydrogenase